MSYFGGLNQIMMEVCIWTPLAYKPTHVYQTTTLFLLQQLRDIDVSVMKPIKRLVNSILSYLKWSGSIEVAKDIPRSWDESQIIHVVVFRLLVTYFHLTSFFIPNNRCQSIGCFEREIVKVVRFGFVVFLVNFSKPISL